MDKRKLVYERYGEFAGNLNMDWRDFVYETEDRRKNGHAVDCNCWVCDYRWQYRHLFYAGIHDEEDEKLYRFTDHCEFQYRGWYWQRDCSELTRSMCAAFGIEPMQDCTCTIPF